MRIAMSTIGFIGLVFLMSGLSAQETTSKANGNANRNATAATQSASTQVVDKSKTTKADWPMFRGDQHSTGVARTTLPDSLEVLWQHKVKQGAFEATPAIANHNGKPVAYIGDLDGALFAFDLKSGEVLWKNKVEIGYVTAPSIREGKLFIGDIDGYFYCLNQDDGKQLWKFETNAEINSSANFYKDNVIFGSQDTKLYAVNMKTGKSTWEHETADQVRCSATIVDNRAFVAGCDGGLHLVGLDDGKEVSAVDIQSPTGVTPAVQGDLVYVGTEQAGFFAIDWKKAEVVWHFEADGNAPIRSCPAVNKEHVIFGAQDRTVYSLDPDNGKKNWSKTLKSKIDSSPVIVGKRVFVGSTDGRLYALSLADGSIVWEKQLNGGILGSPAVAYERLVIATDRGLVYCLGSKE